MSRPVLARQNFSNAIYRRANTDIASAGGTGSTDPKLTVMSSDNHVYFYSDVNSDRCLDLVRNLRDIDVLLINQRDSRMLGDEHPFVPIWLHINSNGGDLFTALAVADQINMLQSPVYSIVEGCAASAATLISTSCTKRYILPSSFMLIHQLSTMFWGKHEDFEDEIVIQNMAMEAIVNVYAKNTKMSEEFLRESLRRETWMDANDCVKLGLADEIMAVRQNPRFSNVTK